MKPIIITIDGNIGAGKSTFLNYLREKFPNFHYIDEPVDIWTNFKNESGETLLEVYYKDKKRWAFSFQNCVFLTRIISLIKHIKEWNNDSNPKSNVFVTERCVETDFNIFVKMLYDDGFINKLEWNIYKQWYHYLILDYRINGIIYIKCEPEKCKERIGKRGRTGEQIIALDYLNKLHSYHEKWINETYIPVITFETNLDVNFEENNTYEKLNSFIDSL